MIYDGKVFTYKLTHDTGFAPNPFGGICTLATCKPCMRKNRREGDWIAGFTSKQLYNNLQRNCPDVPRLVYLMLIEDKVKFEKYWNNRKYDYKKTKKWIRKISCIFNSGRLYNLLPIISVMSTMPNYPFLKLTAPVPMTYEG